MKLSSLKKLTTGQINDLPDGEILKSIFDNLNDCYTKKEIENKLDEFIKTNYKKKSCMKTLELNSLFMNIDLICSNKFVVKNYTEMTEEEIVRCIIRSKNRISEFGGFQDVPYKHISTMIINELIKMGLSKDIIEKCKKYLAENPEKCYEGDRYMLSPDRLSIVEKAEMNIENKLNNLNNHKLVLKLVATMLSVTAMTGAVSGMVEYNRSKLEKYENTKIIYDNMSYDIDDVFVVYNKDTVYYCTRELYKITESEKIEGNFIFGFGSVNECYYRDDIYNYYDIKTGEKICQDHQDGYYIESLFDIYDVYTANSHNFLVDLEYLEQERNMDFLLSNKPNVKIKK